MDGVQTLQPLPGNAQEPEVKISRGETRHQLLEQFTDQSSRKTFLRLSQKNDERRPERYLDHGLGCECCAQTDPRVEKHCVSSSLSLVHTSSETVTTINEKSENLQLYSVAHRTLMTHLARNLILKHRSIKDHLKVAGLSLCGEGLVQQQEHT